MSAECIFPEAKRKCVQGGGSVVEKASKTLAPSARAVWVQGGVVVRKQRWRVKAIEVGCGCFLVTNLLFVSQ